MSKDFSVEMRLKAVDAKLEAIRQNLQAVARVMTARTDDLRRSHNNLVRAVKEGRTNAMPCGHDATAVASSDEGTNYCGECEREAREND